jgi:hypothetical protein
LFVKKVRICSLQYLIFQWLLDLNYNPLSALNEANLTSATQTLNFNPTMHYQVKPDGKIRNFFSLLSLYREYVKKVYRPSQVPNKSYEVYKD